MRPFLTFFKSLKGYSFSTLRADAGAGLTVGLILVPQGLAYAMLAGLPPEYGLYAALVPQVVHSLLSSSHRASVGPVSMDSIMVAAVIGGASGEGGVGAVKMAVMLALLVGSIQFLFGLFRFGFFSQFLSKPIVSAFTTGAAFLITISQIPYFIGGPISSLSLESMNLLPLMIGVGSLFLLLIVPRITKLVPASLLLVVLSIVGSYVFTTWIPNVDMIGAIPDGFPSLQLPLISWQDLRGILPAGLAIALVGYLEISAISKSLETDRSKPFDADQELIALGASNALGGFLGGFPVSASFSRSAIKKKSGAVTNVSNFFSLFVVLIAMFWLGNVFEYLPKVVLGAVIVVAVSGLIDFKLAQRLFNVNRADFAKWLVTFLATVLVGVVEGIACGVLLSVVQLLYRTSRPHLAELGMLPSGEFRNKERFKDAAQRSDVLVIRFDAQLYYANADFFVTKVKQLVRDKGDDLGLVVLNSEGINYMDITGLEALEGLIEELDKFGVKLYMSCVVGPVRDFLTKSDFVAQLGETSFFLQIQDAIDFYDKKLGPDAQVKFRSATQTNVFKEKEV